MNGKSFKVCCIYTLVIAVTVAVSQSSDDGSTSGSAEGSAQSQSEVSYKRHANPADPVILSAETPNGNLISMLGNKSASGEPQEIEEFFIENPQKEGQLTSVFMNKDGSIKSGVDNDGLRIDFSWDESQTMVYTSVLLNNGSQQLPILVDLTEPVDENFTDFDIDSDIPFKRSLKNDNRDDNEYQLKSSAGYKTITKRQSDTTAYASVFVSVESCNRPESNARVFADVLLDYDQDSGTYKKEAKYWGARSSNPGEYEVRISTSKASMIGEKTKKICNKIKEVLGKVCEYYSKANKVTRSLFRHDVDSVLCFKVTTAVSLAFKFPPLPVYRSCKKIFKPLKVYCNIADKDIIPGIDNTSPVDLICESLPLADNGIDLLNEKDIFFTPTAIVPSGNYIQTTGKVLSLQPGTSTVPQRFTIADHDQCNKPSICKCEFIHY